MAQFRSFQVDSEELYMYIELNCGEKFDQHWISSHVLQQAFPFAYAPY